MASDAAILAALAGIGDESTYYTRDPYFQAGQQIRQIETPKPRNSTEAFLLPFIKGIGGGAVTGHGKQTALETALGDIAPAYKTLTGKEYEKRPDWSIQQGKVDLLSALLEKEQENTLQVEKQKQFGDLQRSLVGQGIDVNPETGQYSSNPQILAALEATEEAKARAKAKYREPDKSNKTNIPAANLTQLSKSKGVVDEANVLAKKLELAGQSWGTIQAAKAFSGLDKDAIGLEIKNLADRLARARTGAAMNQSEVKLYGQIVGGDVTASPKQIAKLLKKLAEAESRISQSEIGLFEALDQGGMGAMKSQFDIPQIPKTSDGKYYIDPETKTLYPVE